MIRLEEDPVPRCWVLIFHDMSWPNEKLPLVRGHVAAMTWTRGRWLLVEWTTGGPVVRLPDDAEVLRTFATRKTTLVYGQQREAVLFPLPIWTCVQMCKRLIGLRDVRIQTVAQLERWADESSEA